MAEKVLGRLILEIMGRPPEHIVKTLEMLIERLSQEKGIIITLKKVHEPRAVEGSKDIFTSFAEVEAEFDSTNIFLGIIFAYMPSNVEVISPQNFKLTNEEFSSLGNNLVARLHGYEALMKKLVAEREILINRINAGNKTDITKKEPVLPVVSTKKKVKKSKKGKK